MKRKCIGVRKSTKLTVVFGALQFCTFCISLVFWALYYLDYPYQSLYDYGIEVEAEIVEVYERKIDPQGSSADNFEYHLYYLYISPEGYVYNSKARGFYKTREKAEAQLGKKIIITIEPWEGGYSVNLKKSQLKERNFTRDLILAIVFSFPLIINLYLLINTFRKDRIDRKLCRDGLIAKGEIVSAKGWLLKRITVTYTDGSGSSVNRKIYRLFTQKDTEYLQSLGALNLLVYKKHINVDVVKLIPPKTQKA